MQKVGPTKSSTVYGDEEFFQMSRRPKGSVQLKWFKEIINRSLLANIPLEGVSFFLLLIDFSTRGFLYVSEGIVSTLGYNAREFKRKGMAGAVETLHTDDRVRVKQMHEDIFAWHFSRPLSERLSYRYSQELRVMRKNGSVVWLQTNDFFLEMDDDGKPLITFQLCSDVTHLKKDLTIHLKIYKVNKNGRMRLVKTQRYPLNSQIELSKRELEILQLLSKGLSSKQIGGKLSISEKTVSKHRQNMLRKTGLPNSSALVNYANGLN